MDNAESLRMALLIACIELTGDDYLVAQKVAEHFYEAAPKVLRRVAQSQAAMVPATNFAAPVSL